MNNITLFTEVKEEILRRARASEACSDEYKRAYKSESFKELLEVVTDNISFCCAHKVIDVPLLKKIGAEICNENNLYFSGNITKGYALVDNATITASGNATIWASGNATVNALGNATVNASGNATVNASGNATVIASENASVMAWNNATIWASGNVKVEASGSTTITASGNAIIITWDNARVEASENAYINSYNSTEHKLTGRAIARYFYENRLVVASDMGEVTKLEQ